MKKLYLTLMLAAITLVFNACGASDEKNEAENYPTYDTTQQTNHINDSSEGRMQSEGDLRHNIEDSQDNQQH